MNVPAKFKVRSFTVPELIGGSPKIWGSPWLCPHALSIPQKKSYMPTIQTIPLYVHSFDFRLEFWVGLRTPNFGEGEAVGGRGWYRSKECW